MDCLFAVDFDVDFDVDELDWSVGFGWMSGMDLSDDDVIDLMLARD